jgi:hypothetical protein
LPVSSLFLMPHRLATPEKDGAGSPSRSLGSRGAPGSVWQPGSVSAADRRLFPRSRPSSSSLRPTATPDIPRSSPDGTRLAYVASRLRPARPLCRTSWWCATLGRGFHHGVEGQQYPVTPYWAADGRFLIAGLIEPGGQWKTVAVSALGGTLWSLPGWG